MPIAFVRATVALLLAAALPACGGEEAGEEDEHPSVVVTQWNDSTELFLEYPHLLAGEATGNWAIHMTDMKTFKPITAGTLAVEFAQNGNVVKSFDITAPARDGIFLLDPVIEQPGTYEVRLVLNSAQVRSSHMLPAVQVYPDRASLPASAPDIAGISFLKEQAWKIPFAIEPAVEEEIARAVAAPGEIAAPDGSLVIVSAPITGIALAAGNRNAPSVGQPVSAGQVLAIFAPAGGGEGFARARGEIERLVRELARAQRLYDAGAIPLKRLEETRHDLEIARAEMAAMGGGADGDFQLRVRAPISGVVSARSFVPGGPVQAGHPLFTIVDPSTLWLRVHLPAAAAASLPRNSRAAFSLEGSPGQFETEALVSVGTVLDPRTRTVPVVFTVDNRAGTLRVGQLARANVPVGGTVRGVAIPNGAILDDNGTPVAYVQISGETFERRVLTPGGTDGRRTQVIEGIKPGEMVVTIGAYQIRLASLSPEGFSGGHAH